MFQSDCFTKNGISRLLSQRSRTFPPPATGDDAVRPYDLILTTLSLPVTSANPCRIPFRLPTWLPSFAIPSLLSRITNLCRSFFRCSCKHIPKLRCEPFHAFNALASQHSQLLSIIASPSHLLPAQSSAAIVADQLALTCLAPRRIVHKLRFRASPCATLFCCTKHVKAGE